MRRAGVLLLVFMFIAIACATTTPVQGPALVSRAVQAEGGADALSAALKKQGISPARFAGGHGSIADYAPLAALEGK